MLRSETASTNENMNRLNSQLNILLYVSVFTFIFILYFFSTMFPIFASETHFVVEQLLAERRLLLTRQLFLLFPVHVPRVGVSLRLE